MRFIPSHKSTVDVTAERLRISAYTTALLERFKEKPADLAQDFSATPGAETVKDYLFKTFDNIDELTG